MSGPTTWHHDVSQAHGGLDVLLKRRLDKLVVLLDDALDVSAPFGNVPPEPTHEPDVRVGIHEYFHVQQLREGHKPRWTVTLHCF